MAQVLKLSELSELTPKVQDVREVKMKRYFQWPLDGIMYACNRFAQGDCSTEET